MIAAVFNMGGLEFIAGALAVAFPGGILAFLKLRPEKDALIVTAAQGATTILNGVIDALHEELDRRDRTIVSLRTENDQLRELAGRRWSDDSAET